MALRAAAEWMSDDVRTAILQSHPPGWLRDAVLAPPWDLVVLAPPWDSSFPRLHGPTDDQVHNARHVRCNHDAPTFPAITYRHLTQFSGPIDAFRQLVAVGKTPALASVHLEAHFSKVTRLHVVFPPSVKRASISMRMSTVRIADNSTLEELILSNMDTWWAQAVVGRSNARIVAPDVIVLGETARELVTNCSFALRESCEHVVLTLMMNTPHTRLVAAVPKVTVRVASHEIRFLDAIKDLRSIATLAVIPVNDAFVTLNETLAAAALPRLATLEVTDHVALVGGHDPPEHLTVRHVSDTAWAEAARRRGTPEAARSGRTWRGAEARSRSTAAR